MSTSATDTKQPNYANMLCLGNVGKGLFWKPWKQFLSIWLSSVPEGHMSFQTENMFCHFLVLDYRFQEDTSI